MGPLAAEKWLTALRDAEREWKATDYRTPEYHDRVNEVLRLVKRPYILNALSVLYAFPRSESPSGAVATPPKDSGGGR